MQTSETIAVLGAGGTLGFAMARNMARAGLPVRAGTGPGTRSNP
jgi:NAD(P)-dependent dehydrogenase (short-subunit alcohol dehydrogenase family)